MRKLSVVLLSLLFILCAMLGISACNSPGDGKELPSSDIYKKVNPSVAMVSINKLQGSTSGTGFFIDNNGTLVTNYNVIKDGVSGKIQLHNGTTADIGNVLGYDETLNIAVLETKATNTTPVAISQANSVEVGDTVYAIGYPSSTKAGASSSVFSTGMVSSFLSDGTLEYIQSNIEITDGNSGGVLINSAGKVIGITTAKVIVNGSNYMNLSIPIEEMNNVALDDNESLEIVTKRHYPVYVNFYVDGEIFDTQELKYDTVLSKLPDAPTKVGYLFDNWYADPDCTELFDFSVKITSNVNVYSKFNLEKYKISFNLNSGNWDTSIPNDFYTINDCQNILPIPIKKGYLFEGWLDDTEKFIDCFPDQKNLKDLTLTASWIEGAEGLTIENGIVVNYIGQESSIYIPSIYRKQAVTQIGASAFANNKNIEEVVIAEGILKIDTGAFSNCINLSDIQIPDSIVSIESLAFCGCECLKEIKASSNIAGIIAKQAPIAKVFITNGEAIPDYAFQGCKNLTDVVFLDNCVITSIGNYAFANCNNLTEINIPQSVTYIGNYAFYACNKIVSIDLSEQISSIEEATFYGCKSLINIDLTNVKSIGMSSFYNCIGLTKLYLPRANSIEENAFEGCINIKEISSSSYCAGNLVRQTRATIVTILTGYSIDDDMFSNCETLIELNLCNGIRSIGDNAFNGCKNLIKLKLPDSVESIGDRAFEGCINLISWENGVGYVDNWAVDCNNTVSSIMLQAETIGIAGKTFNNCQNLKNITIPQNVLYIADSAFVGCNNIEELSVSAVHIHSLMLILDPIKVIITGGDKIEYGTFYKSKNLTNVILSDEITIIEGSAFEECLKLEEVVLSNNLKIIGAYAFEDCSNLKTITIPDSIQYIEDRAFSGCDSLSGVYISDLASWCEITFVGYPVDGSSNPLEKAHNLYLNGELLTEVVIPNSVTAIKDYTFKGCTSLINITLSENVENIGKMAFYHCVNLKNVDVKGKVKEIGANAFDGCYNLLLIDFPEDSVITFGEFAFSGCVRLTEIIIPQSTLSIERYAFAGCRGLVQIVIPHGTTSIGFQVFDGCSSLVSIIIPKSVTTIGGGVFNGCRNLTIYMEVENKPQDWSIGWNCGCPVVWGYKKN